MYSLTLHKSPHMRGLGALQQDIEMVALERTELQLQAHRKVKLYIVHRDQTAVALSVVLINILTVSNVGYVVTLVL